MSDPATGPDPAAGPEGAAGPEPASTGRDAPRPPGVDAGLLLAAARLVHPFPSILDGGVVALIALLSGGGVGEAVVLGASMTCLQFAIGAANDLVDAPSDVGLKPGKPIPAGIVSVAQARAVAVAAAALGLLLALTAGGGLLVLAIAILAVGLAYDLYAKGTTLSWLPFALGIPLLPVFGWYGATGGLPAIFLVLVPAAAIAGTALAISNAIVDVERDQQAGVGSVAIALGRERASALVLALHLVVAVLAVSTAVIVGAPTGWVVAVLAASAVPTGGGVLGVVAAAGEGVGIRELAWEVQAVGTGLLAVAFLAALSAAEDLAGG